MNEFTPLERILEAMLEQLALIREAVEAIERHTRPAGSWEKTHDEQGRRL